MDPKYTQTLLYLVWLLVTDRTTLVFQKVWTTFVFQSVKSHSRMHVFMLTVSHQKIFFPIKSKYLKTLNCAAISPCVSNLLKHALFVLYTHVNLLLLNSASDYLFNPLNSNLCKETELKKAYQSLLFGLCSAYLESYKKEGI